MIHHRPLLFAFGLVGLWGFFMGLAFGVIVCA